MKNLFYVLLMGWLAAATAGAAEFRLESAGVRYGISDGTQGDHFQQTEAFVAWELPWRLKADSGWYLSTRLDVSAGALTLNSDTAFIATLGPAFLIGKEKFPVALDLGSSPTYLTRDEFGTANFGVPFQFTSHAGIFADLGARVRLGYRFQHMSNAGLSSHNPGLNLHMVTLGYRF